MRQAKRAGREKPSDPSKGQGQQLELACTSTLWLYDYNAIFVAERPTRGEPQYNLLWIRSEIALVADLARLQVLLVDDNAHMLQIVRTILRGFGCRSIFECRDPAEAFDLTRNESIDLIVVDYRMDLLDGLEFTRLIRTAKDSANPYVPIILLTAYTERSRITEARDAGVSEVCAKPVTAEQLWLKISSCVNNIRPFVRAKTYCGPDRRRRSGANYFGPDRRRDDSARPA